MDLQDNVKYIKLHKNYVSFDTVQNIYSNTLTVKSEAQNKYKMPLSYILICYNHIESFHYL